MHSLSWKQPAWETSLSLSCLQNAQSAYKWLLFQACFLKYWSYFFSQRQQLVMSSASCHWAAQLSLENCGSAGVQQFHNPSCSVSYISLSLSRITLWEITRGGGAFQKCLSADLSGRLMTEVSDECFKWRKRLLWRAFSRTYHCKPVRLQLAYYTVRSVL